MRKLLILPLCLVTLSGCQGGFQARDATAILSAINGVANSLQGGDPGSLTGKISTAVHNVTGKALEEDIAGAIEAQRDAEKKLDELELKLAAAVKSGDAELEDQIGELLAKKVDEINEHAAKIANGTAGIVSVGIREGFQAARDPGEEAGTLEKVATSSVGELALAGVLIPLLRRQRKDLADVQAKSAA